MVDSFDASRFELLYDCSSCRHVLYESHLEEKVLLDDAGEWDIAIDDNGTAFVTNQAGEATWCSDLLSTVVIEHPRQLGQVYVLLEDGSGLRLEEFQQRHHSVTVPILAPSHAEPCPVLAHVLKQSVGGAWVLWSLPSLFAIFVGTSDGSTCSKWYQNWWQWWRKALLNLGFDPALHLRKPSKIGEQPESDSARFLSHASLSSYALVALMTRWGNTSKSAREKNKNTQEAWRVCLGGMLNTFVCKRPELEIGIFLDTAVQVRPGLPMQGSNFVRLVVKRGFVDLTPILACDEAPVLATMAPLRQFDKPSEVPILSLCQALDRAGRRLQWLWKQLIFVIACVFDGAVLESFQPEGGGEENGDNDEGLSAEVLLAGRNAQLRSGRDRKTKLKLQIKPFFSDNRAYKLLQYFMSIRRHFAGQGTVHLAVDASRIGRRQRLLGFITRPDGFGAWMPPQAMRDLVTAATMAFAGGSDSDKEAAKASWKQVAVNFWKASTEPEANKPKKLQRTKVFEWLCATTHMLQISTGKGWEAYAVEGDPLEMEDARSLPSVTVTIDQGADGWSACHYLQDQKTNLLLLGDQSHRIWNDAQLGFHDSDLFYYCLITIVILNSDNGPWEQARWWQEMSEGVGEYTKVSGEQCPIYQAYLPQVKAEKANFEVLDQTGEQEDFMDLQSCVQRKQQKVGMTRWFQYIVSTSKFLQNWTSRLIVSLYVCLQLGLFKQGRAADLMQFRLANRDENADIEKSNTSTGREAVRKARAGCKNTLLFVCMMLADRALYQTNVIIVEVCYPVQRWHSEQNRKNRSSEDSLAWWVQQAIEKGMGHINEVLGKLKDHNLMKRLDFHLTGCDPNWLKYDLSDPSVESQDDIAERLGSLAISVAARRLRSLCFFDGFPGMFPGIVDEQAAPKVLKSMQAYDQDMQAIEGLTGKFWERVRARSPMRLVKVRQIFSLARSAGYTRSADLVEVVTRDFSGISQTKLIEDGVRAGRVAETNKGFNKSLCGEQCWQELIDSTVEHEKHRFTRLAWQDEPVPRGVKDRRTAPLFAVKPQAVPPHYKEIVSTKAAAPYFTQAPLLANAHVEDKALIRHCISADCLESAGDSWLCSLAFHGRLLLSNPSVHGGRWFLGCATSGASCLLGLPIETKIHMGKVFFHIGKVDGFYWLPILSPREWQAKPVRWRSPWSIRLQTGRWMTGFGCVLEATAPSDTLLRTAAMHGFFKLPKAGLLQLGRYLAAGVAPQQSLAEVLVNVAEAAMERALTDDEKLMLLRHRIPKKSDIKDFLQSDDGKEMLGEEEAKIVQDDKVSEERSSEVSKEIRAAAKDLAEKIRSKNGRASGSSSSTDGPASKKARRYPSKMKITAEISIDDLNSYLPQGCRFGIDKLDQNWRLSAFGNRYARAWNLHGYEGSARQLIEMAWQLAVDGGYEKECPFKEITLH